MGQHDWVETIDAAVTVCDAAGIIIEMNEGAASMFKKQGGRALIGSNVLDCHPEPARSKLQALLEERRANTYTVEKSGRRKLIHQAPWFQDGFYQGFVEITLPLPREVPHFNRDGA